MIKWLFNYLINDDTIFKAINGLVDGFKITYAKISKANLMDQVGFICTFLFKLFKQLFFHYLANSTTYAKEDWISTKEQAQLAKQVFAISFVEDGGVEKTGTAWIFRLSTTRR